METDNKLIVHESGVIRQGLRVGTITGFTAATATTALIFLKLDGLPTESSSLAPPVPSMLPLSPVKATSEPPSFLFLHRSNHFIRIAPNTGCASFLNHASGFKLRSDYLQSTLPNLYSASQPRLIHSEKMVHKESTSCRTQVSL